MADEIISQHLRVWIGAFGFAAAILGVFLLGMALVWFPFNWRDSQRRALCNKEVEALLHSNDLVEVTRAGIIVQYMECSVSSRL